MINVRVSEEELKFLVEVLSRLPNSSNSFGLFQRLANQLPVETLAKENADRASIVNEAPANMHVVSDSEQA